MSRSAITMRELQKMTAGAIQALERPVTIKSGTASVGVLYPIRKAPRHLVEQAMRLIDEADAKTSPEEKARYARFLGDEAL
jgi:hypothetical protein